MFLYFIAMIFKKIAMVLEIIAMVLEIIAMIYPFHCNGYFLKDL
jgi:hypothetical protein